MNVFHGPNVGPSGRASYSGACLKTRAERQVTMKKVSSSYMTVQPSRGTFKMPWIWPQDSQLSTSAKLREPEVTVRAIQWNSPAYLLLSHSMFQLHLEESVIRGASKGRRKKIKKSTTPSAGGGRGPPTIGPNRTAGSPYFGMKSFLI